VIQITDKLVRVSFETWNLLRRYAFYNESKIKTVVDGIINGKIDPTTGKTI
jgi:hypothetical protein